ncbi:hypothetical protein [Pararhizobium sp. DWP1-1-3]|uniref:hypothetical protein n=1 Tax=Pararhizobium sp. DWP1-1-3 TaxID=2804652 RepID=UPI003CF7792F
MSLIDYRERLIRAKKDSEDQLVWMVEQKVKTQSRTGDEPWIDTTEADLARHKSNIALYEELIRAVDLRLADEALK